MIDEFLDYAQSFRIFAGRRLPTVIVLVFVGAFLEGIGILVLLPFIEIFAGTNNSGITGTLQSTLVSVGIVSREAQLLVASGTFLLLLFLRNIFVWHRDTRLLSLSIGYVDSWKNKLFEGLAKAEWSTLLGLKRTDLEHTILNDVGRLAVGTDQIIRGGVQLIILAVQITIAISISPTLSLLMIVFTSIAGYMLLPFAGKANKLGVTLTQTGRKAYEVFGQFLSGIKLARAHGSEALYVSEFSKQIEDQRNQRIGYKSEQIKSQAFFNSATGIFICVIVLVGLLVLNLPVSNFLVFLVIAARLNGAFLQLIRSTMSFANLLPAYKSLKQTNEILKPQYTIGKRPQKVTASAKTSGAARIQIENLSFHHKGSAEKIFSNLNLTINPGEFIVISGPSGAGKTTLVDLILGFYAPGSGTVTLDGTPTYLTTSSDEWRQSISYISQELFLFNRSLADNLLWPGIEAEEAKIWKALHLVGMDHKIKKLDGGIHTQVGERGQLFSGGERQRLNIARAILRKPRLMIFDEATNALDAAAELKLLEHLGELRGSATIIAISHRLENYQLADRFMRLQNGKLEMGVELTR